MQLTHSISILYLLLTAILWSTGGLLIQSIDAHPFAIASGRSIIAGLILWLFLRKPRFTFSKTQLAGAIFYALTVMLFVLANKLTSAANAILLQYTGPIYVAIFSWMFLKEKVTNIDWFSIIAVFIGMCLFFMDDLSPDGILGNVIAILAGMAFAGLAITLRMQKDESPLESILLGNILTGIIGFAWLYQSMPLSQQSIIGLLLLGIVQLGIPYFLYAKAIKYVTALESILIPVLEPLLNPFWVFLASGEIPGKGAFLGGAIVVIAIIVRSILNTLSKK
jgi:drug/metabolite transporter (DMT)-like permease